MGNRFTPQGVPDSWLGKLGKLMDRKLSQLKFEEFNPEVHCISEITEMLHLAYAHLAEQGLRFTASYQDDTTTASRLQVATTFLATHEGKIIGTISLYPFQENHEVPYYRTPGLCYFGQFGVLPEWAGAGCGKHLFELCIQHAKSSRYQEIALDTSDQATQLIETYYRWGFQVANSFQWGSTNYLSLVMTKRL